MPIHPHPTPSITLSTLRAALQSESKEDGYAAFLKVQSLSDDDPNKQFLLDTCAMHFLQRFAQSESQNRRRRREDLDRCILVNRLVLRGMLKESRVGATLEESDAINVSRLG